MSEELEVLKIVAKRLDSAKIVYMISGSIAANLYTVPRMTRDIDIVVELKRADLDRFVETFENDFLVDREMVKEEVGRNGIFNIIHKEFVLKIDFILRQLSLFQDTAFTRRQKVLIEGQPMWFISPEDLILAKLLWAKDSQSEMQLHDVRNIFRTSRNLDKTYIAKWIPQLGLEEIHKKAGL